MRNLYCCFALLVLTLVTGCQTIEPPKPPPKPQRSVSGEVSYRDHVRLPGDAVLTIQLVSVSPTGGEPTVLTERRFINFRVPFPYRIFSPSGQNVSDQDLAIRATISVRGEVWFATTRLFPADKDKEPAHVDVWLQSALVPVAPPAPAAK